MAMAHFASTVPDSHAHLPGDNSMIQPPRSSNLPYAQTHDPTPTCPPRHLPCLKAPETPKGSGKNIAAFDSITSRNVRAVFTNAGNARSGLTEFEVWEK